MNDFSEKNFSIHIAGENALILYFGESVNVETATRVKLAAQLIRTKMGADIIDIVPSYASIMVMFSIEQYDHHYIRTQLRAVVSKAITTVPSASLNNDNAASVIELPVYYDVEIGPELALIAKHANLTIEQVIDIHQAQEYIVYAIGFAPGFAYLGEVDARIAMPRLSSPRLKVPKGAVAIADRQTAVYPSESPGGWNLIGLCPVDMFNIDVDFEQPLPQLAKQVMPVAVGDIVKFMRITRAEFVDLGGILPNMTENSAGSING